MDKHTHGKPPYQLLLAPECFLKADNVLLTECSQHFNFAQSGFPHDLILCNITQAVPSNARNTSAQLPCANPTVKYRHSVVVRVNMCRWTHRQIL